MMNNIFNIEISSFPFLDGAGIQQLQLYSIQMQVRQLHNLYDINRKQIIRKILDFYVDKVVDGQKG